MTNRPPSQNHRPVYRIDKFKVPSAARNEFLERAREIQSFLSTLPGFVEDAIYEQLGGPGAFNFVTLVAWESAEAAEAAKNAVSARFEAKGFNPQQFRARLGIEADAALYQQIPPRDEIGGSK